MPIGGAPTHLGEFVSAGDNPNDFDYVIAPARAVREVNLQSLLVYDHAWSPSPH
jgi:hypothetical protein